MTNFPAWLATLTPDQVEVFGRVAARLQRCWGPVPPPVSVLSADALLRHRSLALYSAVHVGYDPTDPSAATSTMAYEAVELAALAIRFLLECPESARAPV